MRRTRGVCGNCRRRRALRGGRCGRCRAKDRLPDAAETAVDLGEIAPGVLRGFGRAVGALVRALFD
ncbi:hypothetical protein [uncultured Streptomyces sp.]|uniref:hypothetical protein n=1 Tax=uncultured Streptomyces sp. TaxID=174707 RepID=UPI00262783EA|nr:hypothetical protein [uncultured Streptomyces sp.]